MPPMSCSTAAKPRSRSPGPPPQGRELVPRLLAEFGNLSGALGKGLEGFARHLERFELNGQRVQQDLEALAGGVGDAPATAQRVADNTDYLGQVLKGLAGEDSGLGVPRLTGADAEQRLKAVQELYGQLNERVREAVSATQALGRLRRARRATCRRAPMRSATAERRTCAPVVSGTAPDLMTRTLPLALIGVAVLLLLATAVIYVASANIRRAAETHATQNERNQEAILRLLDELSSLADGDLTVQATVTEDITGAIADSINYAIEALRELVTTINDSAIQLDGTAQTDPGALRAPRQGERRAVEADRLGDRVDRRAWRPRPRKSPATPSAPPTWRGTRSTSRTRAATRCAARSTA